MVSFDGGGSTGSAVWVPADVLWGGTSFILVFDLVGGIYFSDPMLSSREAECSSTRTGPDVAFLSWRGKYKVDSTARRQLGLL